jgi:hypothetical protein
MRATIPFVFPLLLVASAIRAQSPTPIVVQAASGTTVTTTSSQVVATAPDVHSVPDAIKLLEQIKAANEEVLAKQKAAIERLDELQDAADQLRILAKRG